MGESVCIDSPWRGLGMPKACSNELRERVIKAVEMGASRREAAERFDVSASSAVKWLQRWRDSRSAAAKPRGGGVSPLEEFAAQILALIAEQPVQMFGQKYLSNGGNRDALREVEGRGEWSISRRPSRAPRLGSRNRKLDFVGRVVEWDPLHVPDHFIDVRKLLAKSGSPSRRHPMHCQHRHQLRSLMPQGHELSLNRGWPPALRRRSSPQP